MIAARVAAELKKDPGFQVEQKSGGWGELTVTVEGGPEVRMTRFSYPRPSKVVRRVREEMARR